VETIIVASVVAAVGLGSAALALSWPLYFKPKMRHRYERNHHRAKARLDEQMRS
jgi:hypothetical protein